MYYNLKVRGRWGEGYQGREWWLWHLSWGRCRRHLGRGVIWKYKWGNSGLKHSIWRAGAVILLHRSRAQRSWLMAEWRMGVFQGSVSLAEAKIPPGSCRSSPKGVVCKRLCRVMLSYWLVQEGRSPNWSMAWWVWTHAPVLSGYATLAKWPVLSVPHFAHLSNKDSSTHLRGFGKLREGA